MGFIGLYFLVLLGVFFLFLWANLTNYKLAAARVLGSIAFLLLLWVFSKLMLVSGIGWESTRFWMWFMTSLTWILPAAFLHFVIELKRATPGKIYYHFGVITSYLVPIVSITIFSFLSSFSPTKYIFIGQWVWDGLVSPQLLSMQMGLTLLYFIASIGVLLAGRYSFMDILMITVAFVAFFLRTMLLSFNIAVYWRGWLVYQPLLALVSYFFFWLVYRKHFWLEESLSFPVLNQLLKNFSLPILIVKKNHTLWYLNTPMQKLMGGKIPLSLQECVEKIENAEEFLALFDKLSPSQPTKYQVVRIRTEDKAYTFYAHLEVILLRKNIIAGYVVTFTPLESEMVSHLAEKQVRLHNKLLALQTVYHDTIHSLDTPIILTNTEWNITEINASAQKLLGISEEISSVIGKPLPIPQVVKDQMHNNKEEKFIFDIHFTDKAWQNLRTQRKDTSILQFSIKKLTDAYLIVLEDKEKASQEEHYQHFENRFYRSLHQLTITILENPSPPPWEHILTTFREIFPIPGCIVSISEVKHNELVTIKSLQGVDTSFLEKVENLLGRQIFSLPLRIPPHFSMEKSIMKSGKINHITGGLQELFFYTLNPIVAMILEHMIQPGDTYSLGISTGEEIHALLVVIIKKGYTFSDLEWLETFGEKIGHILYLRKKLLTCLEKQPSDNQASSNV
ncbi:PAS domain-containing protein [Thermospira aquatica]|uniref:PAS domain-containing protein n=1 Tax=Thermospira aquatica TaxID=2828656 RepID=A0AAX3BCS9_9SPIR|nr:PAS domain-containing protein [Thermospira aquatica]URA09971.1 PAS domain-containing protein [Thermospira aquatica]